MATETDTKLKGVVGLKNLGNTCYANSALQAFRHVSEMTYLCLDTKSELKKKHDNHSGTLFEAYADLIRTMWTHHKPAFISPDSFWKDMLAAAEKSGYEHFQGRQQQDSHEFLMFLLDQIFEGTKEPVRFVIQRPPPTNDAERRIQGALEGWKAQFEKQYTPVVDIWFGLLEFETECQECKKKTYRYETFNSLKVSVPSQLEKDQRPPTIHEMLAAEWKTEQIEGFHCESCPARTTAHRRVKIWRMPRCLILVFKRFSPDGRKINTQWSYKNEPLNFKDLFSEASPEKSQEYAFTVQSIVDHHGSARGGHYTAQAKNPIDGAWYFYDDESTMPMERGPVYGHTNYMLLLRANN